VLLGVKKGQDLTPAPMQRNITTVAVPCQPQHCSTWYVGGAAVRQHPAPGHSSLETMTQQDYLPDFRALCAELADSLEEWLSSNSIDGISLDDGTDAELIYRARAALAKPKPVPVAERLPEPEDCDAKGRCWWWIVDEPGAFPHWICAPLEAQRWAGYSAWLPHHALPVPQAS